MEAGSATTVSFSLRYCRSRGATCAPGCVMGTPLKTSLSVECVFHCTFPLIFYFQDTFCTYSRIYYPILSLILTTRRHIHNHNHNLSHSNLYLFSIFLIKFKLKRIKMSILESIVTKKEAPGARAGAQPPSILESFGSPQK